MSTVISVVGLTKVFRDFWHRARVRAVNDIDFQIESGEIYGLLGPNGSGKSTTIKMILGLLHPTRGRITVFGQPPDSVRTKMRIGYLPEESYLYRFLNARETLDYYATLFQIPRRERKRRIEELLEMVGLKGAARRPVGEYSKGMARRIGLAQALINDPDLLILDEPTSGLDPVGSKLVKDIIIRLGREFNKTILLSSHLLSDVEEVCQRVAILYGGKIQVKGTMQEVLSQQDKVQITCNKLSDAAIEKIRQIIAAESPELAISTPRDRLESLFLRIVEQAHSQRVETAGAQSAGDIAGFLGAQPAGRELLESLMRTEEVPATPAAPAETRPAVDTDVLAALSSAKAAPEDEALKPSEPVEVDRSVLDTLTGGEGRDDR
ncbi:MAG: ABC transporter ATP-binding protein [Phycisphaerales bacterium]|nr:ABC transporter ATP-binding protein [Phycisphaerales bacterium]